jgi:PAS domain S-box-containing protein
MYRSRSHRCVTSAGQIIGASKISRDITERKRTETLLRRQADLLDQSHDAIFVWKVPGGITYWSRGAEELYGYTREEAIGRVSHELLRTRADVPVTEIEAQITTAGSWRGELKHTTRDGRTVIVESRHDRVIYDGEAYALETNRDMTEMKARQERIQLLVHELNHRSKNILSLGAVDCSTDLRFEPRGLHRALLAAPASTRSQSRLARQK